MSMETHRGNWALSVSQPSIWRVTMRLIALISSGWRGHGLSILPPLVLGQAESDDRHTPYPRHPKTGHYSPLWLSDWLGWQQPVGESGITGLWVLSDQWQTTVDMWQGTAWGQFSLEAVLAVWWCVPFYLNFFCKCVCKSFNMGYYYYYYYYYYYDYYYYYYDYYYFYCWC